MGWVWAFVVVWVLLAVPVAVLLGRTTHRADREELETPDSVSVPSLRTSEPYSLLR